MSQTDRHNAMVELIQNRGFMTIEELTQHFKVTPQTIRRDLNQLAKSGQLNRYHGGAGVSSTITNTAYGTRQALAAESKRQIAQQVAARIPNHCSLFINIGTTTEAIASALLNHQGLHVITNNLHVASILSGKDDFNVIMAGGNVRADGGIVGQATIDFIQQFKVDYAVLGISGIDDDGSLLDFDYQEVRVSQALVANSRHVYLAADHTKFGRGAITRMGHLKDIDVLFTDQAPPAPITSLLNQHQIELVTS